MTHAEALAAAHIAYADHGYCIEVDREWRLYHDGIWSRIKTKGREVKIGNVTHWQAAVDDTGCGVDQLIEAVRRKQAKSGVEPGDWMGGEPW